MKIAKNESNTDRAIRIIVGAVVLTVALLKLTGTAQVVAIVVGAIALITGLVGFCALYSLLGVKTLKK